MIRPDLGAQWASGIQIIIIVVVVVVVVVVVNHEMLYKTILIMSFVLGTIIKLMNVGGVNLI
jgi:hypothetical protein